MIFFRRKLIKNRGNINIYLWYFYQHFMNKVVNFALIV